MIKDIISKNSEKKITDREIEGLKEYFPSCFTKDGNFDIKKMENILIDKIDITREGYELNFLGKNYAKLLGTVETTTVVKPRQEHNEKEENSKSENMYISGDNLEALKHLVKSYASKVKFIFIDPPYNTGNDGFIYSDKFNFTEKELEEKLSIDEQEARKIIEMTNRKSSSHSAWLTFMYPRLLLAKELLSDDGVIFISIDDNEQANLKLLCDDIFGEDNFISSIIWEKIHTRKNSANYFSASHDYILCYARNKIYDKKDKGWRRNLLKRDDTSAYTNPDNDPKGAWKHDPIYANNAYDADYKITKPNGVVLSRPQGKYWRYSEETIKQAIIEGKVIWGDGSGYPTIKRYLSEVQDGLVPTTIFKRDFAGDNVYANNEIKELFGMDKLFSYPKPTKLIEKLIEIGADKDSIILDFFSGSGSTAHAVLKANAKDGGKRKFIAVQIPEKLGNSVKKGENDSAIKYLSDNKFPLTLDYIGINRIIEASKKIKMKSSANIDYGFKCYELCEVDENTLDKIEKFDVVQHISDKTILEEFGVNTVLATWLLKDGYGLNSKVEEINLKGYSAYICEKHLYMINSDITEESIMELIEKFEREGVFTPENIVLFGYSFVTWSEIEILKNNIKQLNNSEKNLKVNVITRY